MADKILYRDLSYKLRGLLFKISNQYGLGLKEKIYQNAFEDELKAAEIKFVKEPKIEIFSVNNGKIIGYYIPDFLIEKKIIIELKSEPFITKKFYNQTYSYLRVSRYELALLVNFGEEKLVIKRLIFTNDRKPHLSIRIREYP